MPERTAGSDSPGALLDVIVVGAGFAGVYAVYKFRRLGFSVQAFEAGGDVGGTWYWNRYPGCRCDIESIYYSYQFDDDLQQEWEWTERYASQPEILSYIRHVADRFDLRRNIRFNTRVTAARFEAASGDAPSHWTVTTDDGKTYKARFCVMASGVLSTPSLPDIPGRDTFAGSSYHTGRWPHEEVDFTGLKVAVIGTGSSGIQSIPLIAEQAEHVTVFQRTPNYAVPAGNRPLDPHELSEVKSRYREVRAASWKGFTALPFKPAGRSALAVSGRERDEVYEQWWRNHGLAFQGAFADLLFDAKANRTAADFVRRKIRELVDDEENSRTAYAGLPAGLPAHVRGYGLLPHLQPGERNAGGYQPGADRKHRARGDTSGRDALRVRRHRVRHRLRRDHGRVAGNGPAGPGRPVAAREVDGRSARLIWAWRRTASPNLFMVNGPGQPVGADQHGHGRGAARGLDRRLHGAYPRPRAWTRSKPWRSMRDDWAVHNDEGSAKVDTRRLRVLVHRRQHPRQAGRLHALRGRIPGLRAAMRAGRGRRLRGLYADLTKAAATASLGREGVPAFLEDGTSSLPGTPFLLS